MSKRLLYRLAILVSELQQSVTEEYKISVMSLINCLIHASEDIWTRHSMRCELVSIGFLDIIDNFRTTADGYLIKQVETFDEKRMHDDDDLELTDEKPLYDLITLFLHKVKLSI